MPRSPWFKSPHGINLSFESGPQFQTFPSAQTFTVMNPISALREKNNNKKIFISFSTSAQSPQNPWMWIKAH